MTVDEAIKVLQEIRVDDEAGNMQLVLLHPDQGGPYGEIEVLRKSKISYDDGFCVYIGCEDTSADD